VRCLRRIHLIEGRHQPTGATKHHHGSAELSPPSQLEIVRYPDDAGFYLLYPDDEGSELTDTYHDSLPEAMRQASREFRVEEDEWEEIANE
jgi:hypothetical protein